MLKSSEIRVCYSTILIEPGCVATISKQGDVEIQVSMNFAFKKLQMAKNICVYEKKTQIELFA